MTPTPERPAPDFERLVREFGKSILADEDKMIGMGQAVTILEKRTALLAAIRALQEERDGWKDAWKLNADTCARLTAENARLKAALDDFVTTYDAMWVPLALPASERAERQASATQRADKACEMARLLLARRGEGNNG